MKKIKLASLALVMAISAAGAYGNAHSSQELYNIMPNTNYTQTSYQVATNPPTEGCIGTGSYVCTVVASYGYSSGQFIPASEAVLFTLYN